MSAKARENSRLKYQASKAAGECVKVSCPHLAIPGKVLCEHHNAVNNTRHTAMRRARKQLVFAHYGAECACCGEGMLEFLTIDHVDGGGHKHRRTGEIGNGGDAFYRWLVKEGLPAGYQTLCWNCNSAKGIYGACPHTWSENNGR